MKQQLSLNCLPRRGGVVMLFAQVAALVTLLSPGIEAADWAGANANWSSNANPGWNGTGVPDAVGAVANHPGAASSTTTQDIIAGVTVGTISLTNNSNHFWSIALTNPITLNQDNAGAGFATISNTNTNTGTDNFLTLNTGTITLADDLLISNTGASTNTTGAIRIIGTVGGTGNVTLSNVNTGITQTGSIRFQTATNTFTGSVLVQRGTTTYNTAGAFGNSANVITLGQSGQGSAALLSTTNVNLPNNIVVAAGSGGTLTLGTLSTANPATTYSGTITLNGDVEINNSSATGLMSLTGLISGTGKLTKVNTGQLVVSNGGNTYSGGTVLSGAGTVIPGASSTGTDGNPTSGPFGSGATPLELAGSSMRATTGADITIRNTVTISADTTFVTNSSEKSLTFTGPVTLTGGTRTLNSAVGTTVAGKAVIFSGAIGDGGSGFGITKTGAGTLELSGPSTYGGLTTVSTGLLRVLNANGLGSATNGTTVSSGAILEIGGGVTINSGESVTIAGGGSDFFGALRAGTGGGTWAGTVNLGTTPRIGATTGNTLTVTGSIVDGTGNTFAVSGQGGTGVVVLNPTTSNSYTGKTDIIRGILRLGKNDALPTGTTLDVDSANAVLDAATFDMAGFNQTIGALQDSATTNINGIITNSVVGTSTLTVNQAINTSFDGTIDDGGAGRVVALVKSNTGTLTLTKANTYSGTTVVNGGTLALTDNLGIQFSPFDTSGAGTLDVTAINTPTFGGLISATNFNLPVNVTSLTLNPQSGTVTYSGNLGGGAAGLTLTKTGAGTQVLSGSNAYSGLTTVSAGVLVVGNNSALGTTANGTTVASGARLSLNNGITVTGEELTISGDGGSNFFGALQAASSATASWTGTINLGPNARVGGVNSGSTLTLSGVIQDGAGTALLISGGGGSSGGIGSGGVVLISGTGNTYTGNTNIIRGVLRIGADNALPVGTVLDVDSSSAPESATFDLNNFNQTVAALQRTSAGGGSGSSFVTNSGGNLRTLTVNQASNTTYSGQMTGTNLALTKSGVGNLTLTGVSGANDFAGPTNILAGTLTLSGSGNLTGTSAIGIATGAELDTTALAYVMSGSQPFTFDIDGAGAGSAGLLDAGSLNITSGVVSFNVAGVLDDPAYVFANYTGLTGAFFASAPAPAGYYIDYNYLGGNQIALVQIPEPSTLAMLAFGMMTLWLFRKRKV